MDEQEDGLRLSDSLIDFGAQLVGSTSDPTTLVIENNRSRQITISSVSVQAPFSMSGATFPRTLRPGAKLSVTLTFSPTVIGAAVGSLTVRQRGGGNKVV